MTEIVSGPEEPQHSSSTALTIHKSSDVAPSTTQTGNIVQGHLAARDVNVFSASGDQIFHQSPPTVGRTVFRKLFDKLEQETAADQTLTTYIKQLEIYTRHVDDEKIIGLEEKLKSAGREHQLMFATALKENVYAEDKGKRFLACLSNYSRNVDVENPRAVREPRASFD